VPLHLTSPDGELCRIGHSPDPWTWVPWEYAPFTGRWDDPQALFRTIYAASSPEAAFVEILAQFRPDPGLADDLAAIDGDSEDSAYPSCAPGCVHIDWVRRRRLGFARVEGRFVDVGHSSMIAELRPALLHAALAWGLPDFDAAAIRVHAPRDFTQHSSRHIYRLMLDDGDLASGVAFSSRHGDDFALWAVYEREADAGRYRSHALTACRDEEIDTDGPAFHRALELHGLVVEGAF
jgi:hypothetical protein